MVYGLLELSGSILSLANGPVRKHINRKVLVAGGMLACGLLIALNGVVSGVGSFAVFALTMCLPDLFHASSNAMLHEGIPSNIRATMLSLESFVISLFIGASYTVSGFLFEMMSPSRAIAVMSLFPLFAVASLMLSFSLKRTEETSELGALPESV